MQKSPFKFLDSYSKEDRDIFFGRERETEELYSRVFLSNILLMFGVSGTGKSSLINCGLGNKFQDSDWLPIFIRRGNDINTSLRQALIKQAITPVKDDKPLKKIIQSLYLDHFKPIYLIFDQFEELFIFGSDEEKDTFIEQVKTITDSDLNCRFIFSMREEYLANITEFEEQIPTFLDNRIRIEKMTKYHARQVIEGPCKVFGIELEQGFAANLLEKLSPESAEVELTYLQVFLDKIFRIARERNPEKIVFSNDILTGLGKISDILGTFLEEQIDQLDDPDTGLAMLKSFVSVKGTKKQVTEDEIKEFCQSLGKDLDDDTLTDYLQKFINLRILRDKDENDKYELRHDSLAAKIYEKITVVEKELIEIRQFIENAFENYNKRKILLSEADLKYIAPYEDKLFLHRTVEQFIADSKFELGRVKRRRRNIAIAVAVILFIILSGFTIWALIERKAAQEQRNIAVMNSKIARSNELASYCMLNLERNPTLSFGLAERAYQTHKSKLAMEALSLSYETGTYNPFHINLIGHKGAVYTLDYNPADKKIVTASLDNTAKVWSLDGELLLDLKGHSKQLFSAKFSNDGKYIVAASLDSTAKIWDLSGNLVTTVRDSNQWIYLADFSNDGKYLVTASVRGDVIIWKFNKDKKGCEKLHLLKGHTNVVNSINISSDDKLIATTARDNTARLWNFNGESVAVLAGHKDWVRHSSFSPDNQFIITASDDRTAIIWDLNGKPVKVLKAHNAAVTRASYAPNGKYIVTVSQDGNAIVWDERGHIIRVLKATLAGIDRFAISRDSRYIATAANNGISQVWEYPGNLLYELKRHDNDIWDIQFIDDHTIITASQDETAKIWNIGQKEVTIINTPSGRILNAIYNQEQKELITTDSVGLMCLIRIPDNSVTYFENYKGDNLVVKYSPDKKYIITASGDKTARIWDKSGKQILLLKHTHPVASASFAPDGKTIVTAGGDGYVRTWTNTGQMLKEVNITFESLRSATFSPDGKIILATSKQKVLAMLDSNLNIIKTFSDHEGEVLKAVYSPDGKFIVSASSDGIAILRDKDGNPIKTLEGHRTPITAVNFSSNGEYFYTLSEKPYLIQVWNTRGDLQTVINLGKSPDTDHYVKFDTDNKQLIVFTNTRGRIFIKRWPLLSDIILEMVNQEKVLGNVRELTPEEKAEFNISE